MATMTSRQAIVAARLPMVDHCFFPVLERIGRSIDRRRTPTGSDAKIDVREGGMDKEQLAVACNSTQLNPVLCATREFERFDGDDIQREKRRRNGENVSA